MSFADRETILELTEQLIASAWPHQLNIPLPRLKYQEVMQKYGSDKPDLRLEVIFLIQFSMYNHSLLFLYI